MWVVRRDAAVTWVRVKNALRHPQMLRTAPTTTNEEFLSLGKAEAEKP